MILHTLNSDPGAPAFSQCLTHLQHGDALLLMGNGVYGAVATSPAAQQLLLSGATLYILADDARAAGVINRLADAFSVVDYDGFVGLSEHCASQLAWY